MGWPAWAVVVAVAVGFPVGAIAAHVAHEFTHVVAAHIVRARVEAVSVGTLAGGVHYSVDGRAARSRRMAVSMAPTLVAVAVAATVHAVAAPRLTVPWVVGGAVLAVYGWPSASDLRVPATWRGLRATAARVVDRARPHWPVPVGWWVGFGLLYLSWGIFAIAGDLPAGARIVVRNLAGGLAFAGAIKAALAMHEWRGASAATPTEGAS